MPFKIQKATLQNVQEIAELLLSVSTSPRLLLEFGSCKREEWSEWYMRNVRCEINACEKVGEDEAEALAVIDDEKGRIVGFAVWSWSLTAPHLISKETITIELPEGANVALRRSFTAELQKLEEEYRPNGRHFELFNLATSPQYQRRGIASMLLKYGLEKADREEAQVFLAASPMGERVYRRLEFEEVGKMEIDLESFGGEGVHCHRAMIRKPERIEELKKG